MIGTKRGHGLNWARHTGAGMADRFTTAQSTVAMRRWGPLAIVTLAAMAALTALTADAAAKQARPAQATEATAPREAGEPIMAIVSIKTQQVTFYDAEGWIVRAPVSTGIKGRETPAGVFAVVEKDKDHHSTMYDDAWMPNMQRITWNGLALHGGPLPGYAASHGCVRMPFGFAEKLFDKTRIGMRVIISPDDAEPVEFSHPALFVPNAEAIAAAPAKAETLAREAAEAAKTADEAKKAAATAARETAPLDSVAAQAGAAQGPRRRRTRIRRQGAGRRQDGPGQGEGRGPQAKGRRQGRGSRARNSTPPKPTRNRSSTPPPPQRKPPRRPRQRRPTPPRRRSMRSSRSSRSRSTSAARRRSFTCGATRISRRRTAAARCSMRPSRSRSRSAIPASRSARMCSRRWRATTRACAGPPSRSTMGMTPRTRSTASPSRRKCSIASRRPHCRDPRSSSRTSR